MCPSLMQIGSKTAEKNSAQTNKQTNRQTNKHYENNGHLAVNQKCTLYGLEACPLKKADLRSFDFVIDRLFMKLFRTKNMDTVRQCQQFLNFDLPSVTVANRAANFESKFIANCNNMLLL